jgi:hypothetical protein
MLKKNIMMMNMIVKKNKNFKRNIKKKGFTRIRKN